MLITAKLPYFILNSALRFATKSLSLSLSPTNGRWMAVTEKLDNETERVREGEIVTKERKEKN